MRGFTFEKQLDKAFFQQRINRFVALVTDSLGHEMRVHVPNSGRMKELLVPGADVLVSKAFKEGRKTLGDLVIVKEKKGGWVCIDARLPGKLLALDLEREDPVNTSLQGWKVLKREPSYGKGRFDLLLKQGNQFCLVEAKSVTLVKKGTALFPDAPTLRGKRHMEELAKAYSEGYRAAVIFVVQREDAFSFRPNDEMDPTFGKALRQAVFQGVEVQAFSCQVSPHGVMLRNVLPVFLDTP
ncbi:MAG: DNA/RNA nuclease SfsA [Firmicutes bacterium]|nr:DNA/RNA nuclease SfsA [Bacillota bacterium]